MPIYTSTHTGPEIDQGVSRGLKISEKNATNGKALIWNNGAYEPLDINSQLQLTTDDIRIKGSNNPSMEDDQLLSNIVSALQTKVDKTSASSQINITPKNVNDSHIYTNQMSLQDFVDKVYSKQGAANYQVLGEIIESIGTTPITRSYSHGMPKKFVIYFKNLAATSIATQLIVSIGSGHLIPVLELDPRDDSLTGYIELAYIGYTWKIEAVYDDIGSLSASYLSNITPKIFVYTSEIGLQNHITLQSKEGTITGNLKVYGYIQ